MALLCVAAAVTSNLTFVLVCKCSAESGEWGDWGLVFLGNFGVGCSVSRVERSNSGALELAEVGLGGIEGGEVAGGELLIEQLEGGGEAAHVAAEETVLAPAAELTLEEGGCRGSRYPRQAG